MRMRITTRGLTRGTSFLTPYDDITSQESEMDTSSSDSQSAAKRLQILQGHLKGPKVNTVIIQS